MKTVQMKSKLKKIAFNGVVTKLKQAELNKLCGGKRALLNTGGGGGVDE